MLTVLTGTVRRLDAAGIREVGSAAAPVDGESKEAAVRTAAARTKNAEQPTRTIDGLIRLDLRRGVFIKEEERRRKQRGSRQTRYMSTAQAFEITTAAVTLKAPLALERVPCLSATKTFAV